MEAVAVDNTIYVVGGYDGRQELSEADLLNLDDGAWTNLPPLSTPRGGLALAYDGLAVFALGGGWTYPIRTFERYDPTTNTWSNFPSPIQGEWRHLGAAAKDERLHLVGGWAVRIWTRTCNTRAPSRAAARDQPRLSRMPSPALHNLMKQKTGPSSTDPPDVSGRKGRRSSPVSPARRSC
ncbi:MAG: kelch repeat-containing protein [Caldilineaceae bacterium]